MSNQLGNIISGTVKYIILGACALLMVWLISLIFKFAITGVLSTVFVVLLVIFTKPLIKYFTTKAVKLL